MVNNIIRMLVALLAIACAAGVWFFGIATGVSFAVVMLKLFGLEMVQNISYWMPVQMAGCWLTSFLGLLIATVYMQRKEKR